MQRYSVFWIPIGEISADLPLYPFALTAVEVLKKSVRNISIFSDLPNLQIRFSLNEQQVEKSHFEVVDILRAVYGSNMTFLMGR